MINRNEKRDIVLKYPLGFTNSVYNITGEINELLKVLNHPGVTDIRSDLKSQQYLLTIPYASKGIVDSVKEILKYHNIKSFEIEVL